MSGSSAYIISLTGKQAEAVAWAVDLMRGSLADDFFVRDNPDCATWIVPRIRRGGVAPYYMEIDASPGDSTLHELKFLLTTHATDVAELSDSDDAGRGFVRAAGNAWAKIAATIGERAIS